MIYFVKFKTNGLELIKIGYTTNFLSRIRNLISKNFFINFSSTLLNCVYCPFEMKILKVMLGDTKLERQIHYRFNPAVSEWYSLDDNPSLLDFIKNVTDENVNDLLKDLPYVNVPKTVLRRMKLKKVDGS